MLVLSALSIACRRVAPKIVCKTPCSLHCVNCNNSITSNAMQSLIYSEEALRGGMTSVVSVGGFVFDPFSITIVNFFFATKKLNFFVCV